MNEHLYMAILDIFLN